MPLKLLKSCKGFALDLRPPRPDPVAIKVASEVFGASEVDRVRSKFHRSFVTSERLMEDLFDYDRVYANADVRDEPIYQLALQSVREQYTPQERLVPLTLGAVEQHPDLTRDSAPGLPYSQEGYRTKADVLNAGISGRWHKLWDVVGKGKPAQIPDSQHFFRAQTVDDPDVHKIRTTWGYPFDVLIEESRFFLPYIKWLKTTDQVPIGYQVEIATGGMHYIDDMLKSHPRATFGMLDWRKFDKTIPAWLIRDAFQIMYDVYEMGKVQCSEGKLWPVNSQHSQRRFRKIVNYFINTTIQTHIGLRFRKTGGVPSGSMFTNIIDSIVNAIVMRYLIYSYAGEFPLADIYMGDDSLLVLKDPINLDFLGELAEKKFSMILNTKKSYLTSNPNNVHFLGYYNCDGRPGRNTDFLISSFCDPERTVRDPHITLVRALGEMFATCDHFKAVDWYEILIRLLMQTGITAYEFNSIVSHKKRILKHLKTYGWDLSKISVPHPHEIYCAVWPVMVPMAPRRPYIIKTWNYPALMRANKEYWTTRTSIL
uniref:RdRp n=1 Tax=Beihai partiti-like virus 1 TaxID=1922501 RepID=A0A1L3KLE5_9VIRU|nr:RdRp [Beihai partiti-like virus 1]